MTDVTGDLPVDVDLLERLKHACDRELVRNPSHLRRRYRNCGCRTRGFGIGGFVRVPVAYENDPDGNHDEKTDGDEYQAPIAHRGPFCFWGSFLGIASSMPFRQPGSSSRLQCW
jgi:hypothetical protein